ncbi:MAG: hypothetical protein NUV78_00300 [Candidatus Zambryskibacteria bacterium]|nr:hypothetical protein [Candidatus Zambryskibacteria bacterium]
MFFETIVWVLEFLTEHWIKILLSVLTILGARSVYKERRRRNVRCARMEAERLRLQQVLAENARRAFLREIRFTVSPPKLYFNTVNGVTAVLRENDYVKTRKLTYDTRLDGKWTEAKVLVPAKNTFVFATEQGRAVITHNTGGNYTERYQVVGYPSQLHEVAKRIGASLIRDERIFVPWVNESILHFNEQNRLIQDPSMEVHRNLFHHLIELQAPEELQPLPEYHRF